MSRVLLDLQHRPLDWRYFLIRGAVRMRSTCSRQHVLLNLQRVFPDLRRALRDLEPVSVELRRASLDLHLVLLDTVTAALDM